jgi:Tol biopolymer transport system component
MKFKNFFLAVLVLCSFVSTTVQAAFPGINGKLMFVDVTKFDWQLNVVTINPNGSGVVNLASKTGQNADPAWSADGKHIAFIQGAACCYWNIWTMNADGSHLKQITNSSFSDRWPHWSPDGTKIVFERNENTVRIYTMNADGTSLQSLTDISSRNSQPEFSPDGTQVVFISERDGNSNVYVMNADGTNQTRLTNTVEAEWQPRWSPDGKKIVFQKNLNGNNEIYVMNADGSNPMRLTNNPDDDNTPNWSPDNTKIVFTRGYGTPGRLYTMNPDGTNQQQISTISAGNPQWQPISSTNKTISVTDTGFTPQNITVTMGQKLGWNISGNLVHDIFDNSNIGLFGSGKVSNGGTYGATFFAAGTYPVIDHSNLATGAIHVPLRVSPQTGLIGTTFTVTWSSLVPKSTFSFDVQMKKTDATAWTNFISNTTTRLAKITPAIAGTYAFRSRLRGNGYIGRWSAPKAFTIQ